MGGLEPLGRRLPGVAPDEGFLRAGTPAWRAPAERRWQSVQWQAYSVSGAAVSWKAMAPHRQLPGYGGGGRQVVQAMVR